MSPMIIAILVSLSIGLVGSIGAYFKGHSNGEAVIQAKWDADKEAQRKATEKQKQEWKIIENSITNDVIAKQKQITDLKDTNAELIKKLASKNKPCLPASVISVLSGSVPRVGETGQTGQRIDDKKGTSTQASESGSGDSQWYASEQQVAEYINYARTEYSLCANQLNGLIDWANTVTK